MSSGSELFRLDEVDAGQFFLSGELSFRSAQGALKQTAGVFRASGPVSFDLAGITRADSAGLAILLAWLREAAKRGSSLELLNLPEQLLAIAHVSGVDGMFRND